MTLSVLAVSQLPTSVPERPDRLWRRAVANPPILIGGGIIVAVLAACLLTLPLTKPEASRLFYDRQDLAAVRKPPGAVPGARGWFGTDILGRSLFSRCLIGGTISLGIGAASAGVALILGVSVGLIAGYRG